MLQYVPLLAASGIRVQPHPLLSDAYVRLLHAGKARRSRAVAAACYLRRGASLCRRGPCDLQWVEGELFPFLPMLFERAFMRGDVPFIAEYDDALFHRYGLSRSRVVRSALGGKVDSVMRAAACVIVGNAYLARHAQQLGVRRVEIVPTVVDANRYTPVVHRDHPRPVIGWIGSPVTQHYLYGIGEALREVCARHDAVLRLVGASPDAARHLPGVAVDCVPWAEEGEASLVAGMDIGIMPLRDSSWERGKCGYKLIQYMACALPVVASPVGVNVDLVAPGVNGFLPSTQDEWVRALSALASDAEARQHMGAAGRARVEAEFCTQAQVPRLARIMRSLSAG